MMHNWFRHVFARRKDPKARTPRRLRSFRPIVECLEDRCLLSGSPFIVTNTGDSGAGTLRQAILDLNASSSAGVIDFSIPASGVQVISPTTALPTITEPVTIDGTSQGVSAAPLIQLDGQGTIAGNGLTVGTAAGGSTIKDLSVVGFKANGIELDSSNNTVTKCYFGMLPDGTTADGNAIDGVYINGNGSNTASGNTIGGATAAAGNLLSGNGTGLYGVSSGGSGVDIDGGNASSNLVENNLIGTDHTGGVADGNFSGVFIGDGAYSNTVGGSASLLNVISGNQQGVVITGSNSIANTVAGNLIGLNKAGTGGLGNAFEGVLIQAANVNTVSGNTISGNQNGVVISALFTTPVVGAYANTVQGNFIGTNEAGTAAIPNTNNGVILNTAAGNFIGGASAGQGNLISGNTQRGVVITGTTAISNQIIGNFIGVQANHTSALGNGFQGIYVTNGARGNLIGGTVPGETNVIAFSGGAGVLVGNDTIDPPAVSPADSAAGTGNAILNNSIFGNTSAGIQLGKNGSIPDGSNLNQAAPVLTTVPSVINLGTQLTNLNGTLASTPNTSFTIQFFASNAADGTSQGRNFLGSVSVTTDGSGNATFGPLTITPAVSVTGGQIITATATSSANNSSPFSNGETATEVPQQTIGVFDPNGNWYLRNSNSAGAPDIGPFGYGAGSWYPIVGNWQGGTGATTVGVVDLSTETWYLRSSNSSGGPTIPPFQYGAPGWIPVAGDWTGTGHTGIGVFNPSTATFYLRNEDNAGAPDAGQFQFGGSGWKPVAGDWTGQKNGNFYIDTIGVVDPTGANFSPSGQDVWYLRNSNSSGAPDIGPFNFGLAGWVPVVGDWNGLGHSGIGVVNGAVAGWYLRNEVGSGAADAGAFQYGGANWNYVVGDWDFPVLPQMAAGGEAQVSSGAAALTESQLQGEVQVALNLLASQGVNSALLGKLGSLQFTVGQLPGGTLGLSDVAAGTVEISADAAGYGWFVDANPADSVPANRMDLLTVVLHEMGHFNGWTELDPTLYPNALMDLTLGTGQRRIDALDAVFAAGL